jgi:hypothetical protein
MARQQPTWDDKDDTVPLQEGVPEEHETSTRLRELPAQARGGAFETNLDTQMDKRRSAVVALLRAAGVNPSSSTTVNILASQVCYGFPIC